MPDIVITEFMDTAAADRLAGVHDVINDPGLVDRPEDLVRIVAEARALIVRNRTQVRGDLLAAARRLTCVGRLGVGLDNIDVDACEARGIGVFPATGANDLSVAEYVITAALVLLRRSWFATDSVVAGQWPRQASVGRELSGRTIGLVGFGAIGRETAARARALGMTAIAHDPFLPADSPHWALAGNASFDELLATSDVVSLHTPLTPDTRHLVDARALARMKRDAILVNAARGGIVDEGAVVAALRDGKLGGAALDVFENEPVSAESGRAFAGVPNLLLTPHIAGVTEESNVRVSNLIADRVLEHLGTA